MNLFNKLLFWWIRYLSRLILNNLSFYSNFWLWWTQYLFLINMRDKFLDRRLWDFYFFDMLLRNIFCIRWNRYLNLSIYKWFLNVSFWWTWNRNYFIFYLWNIFSIGRIMHNLFSRNNFLFMCYNIRIRYQLRMFIYDFSFKSRLWRWRN